MTLSLHSGDLARRSPPGGFFLGAGRNAQADPQPACGCSGLGEAYLGLSCSTLPRSNVSCQDQLVCPGGLQKNDFPAVKGCGIVLLFGHLLSGCPTGSSQNESHQRVNNAAAAQPPSFLSQLSDVSSSKALHMAPCLLVIHLTGL